MKHVQYETFYSFSETFTLYCDVSATTGFYLFDLALFIMTLLYVFIRK